MQIHLLDLLCVNTASNNSREHFFLSTAIKCKHKSPTKPPQGENVNSFPSAPTVVLLLDEHLCCLDRQRSSFGQ